MSSIYGPYLHQGTKLYAGIKYQLLFFGYTSNFEVSRWETEIQKIPI
jgi:hypothetical protein